MRDHRRTSTRPLPAGRGFTLTELLVVIAIIGILVTFILVAAQDGIRRAEEKSTQSLIAKLEAGLSERMEAILLKRADISFGHHMMAAVFNSNLPVNGDPTVAVLVQMFGASPNCLLSYQRAQAIAQIDLVRAELPDVFFDQRTINPNFGAHYPLNFGGLDFPGGTNNFLIPLGAYSSGPPGLPTTGAAPGDPNQAIGIFGATWQAAGGIYKNLGYLPQGYDGADNNGDGYVDDLAEGAPNGVNVSDPDNPSGPQVALSALVQRRISLHTHNTARSEMLYALLVEGVGPLGSTFARDEFTNRQVADTDNDGLPEFIDAWGKPLQFFRWPIYYNNLSSTSLTASGIGYVQKGADPYSGISEPRQVDSLDPNQTLVALPWWLASVNGGSGTGPSGNATLFMQQFHSLLDPNAGSLTAAQKTGGAMWDRSGGFARRAFYSRPLILSGGPDQIPGVARLFSANESPNSLGALFGVSDGSGTAVALNATSIIQIENQASPVDPSSRTGALFEQIPATATQTTLGLHNAATDDITNQAMGSPTGGVR
jgi:prepilin-type N-terminal cleavage/methylation domain-containing protein